MLTMQRVVLPLRVFLVLFFGILLVFQTLSFPGKFAYMAQVRPEEAYLRWPLTAVAALMILCVQVVIVATWQLLTLVRTDRIFTTASLKWVDAIVWAIFAGWLVLVSIAAVVVLNADDPGLPMVLFLLSIGVAVLGLVVLVLRELLRQATALRSDLDAVI
ncbi:MULTISPECIES: DUF2975 domain-containing protein [unclassified Crossiella]|uniref:DUF2975 domain-containing protein n=1 Tax=unclassified Crossiella TaxID=2620835 RepID=UPI001FFF664E|nr:MULTISPECIES: DUF2975 domain-containing protein [unclassified Crossiella]MCK2236714.1 DUF2975 domain-containing protein [Crossiella sp. S99.2]MCK2250382.1 DUF2975 domain-containing protein [Crossiella sp. S99.1]